VKLPAGEQKRVMNFIQFYLENRTADDVVVTGERLTFKVRFFRFRFNFNIMKAIDGGEIVIDDIGFNSELHYKILLVKLFVITTIISIIVFLATHSLLLAFLLFLLFCGSHWIIVVIRHSLMLNNILNGIEALVNSPWKSEQSEDDLNYKIMDGKIPKP
jgi:hypothetical protein